MGSLAINAIVARDIPVVHERFYFSAVMFVIVNLIVDLLYGLLDPRIRLEEYKL